MSDEYLAAYVMGDPHVGMLAWAPETLDDHFDLRIAEDLMCEAFRQLMSQQPPAANAMLVNLGDYFHADNPQGVTARSGNVLDLDSRLGKMVGVGERIMEYAVEVALEYHASVDVYNLPGNHDDVLSHMLARVLDARYREEPRVRVCTDPGMFLYHRWGSNLIGLTHGHSKAARDAGELSTLMACDRPQDWGQTTNRVWWTGHIHHKDRRAAKDSRGAWAESFRTLAPLDAYGAGEGYRGRAEMTRIVLHHEWGEECRSVVTGRRLRSLLESRS